MIELSIPEINEESKNVKDRVISILTIEQPLSIMNLANKIRQNYNIRITYQAVRKAVESLNKKGILLKGRKKYSINKEWVLKLKNFFDGLLIQYETGKKAHIFEDLLVKEDYAVYTFTNLLDLDNFWGDLMENWVSNLKEKDNKNYFGIYHYGFWFLINLGRETKIFERFSKKKIKSYMVCFKKCPLNKWGAGLYKSSGVKIRFNNKKDIDESTGINILGDSVIQIRYPVQIINKLDELYQKCKSVDEINLIEITKIAHEPCEIKFILFKNPSIAKSLREKYRKEFK